MGSKVCGAGVIPRDSAGHSSPVTPCGGSESAPPACWSSLAAQQPGCWVWGPSDRNKALRCLTCIFLGLYFTQTPDEAKGARPTCQPPPLPLCLRSQHSLGLHQRKENLPFSQPYPTLPCPGQLQGWGSFLCLQSQALIHEALASIPQGQKWRILPMGPGPDPSTGTPLRPSLNP